MKIYFIIAILLTVGIALAVETAQDYSRPSTGTLIKDNWRSGQGEFAIYNGASLDAVVVLQYYKGPAYLAVYIRSGESYALGGVQDGNYDVYYTLGEDWSSDSNKFTKNQTFFRLNRSLPFNTGWDPVEYQTRNVLSINSPITDQGFDSPKDTFDQKWTETKYPTSGQKWNEKEFPDLLSRY